MNHQAERTQGYDRPQKHSLHQRANAYLSERCCGETCSDQIKSQRKPQTIFGVDSADGQQLFVEPANLPRTIYEMNLKYPVPLSA
jgi:hypothetical protein